MARLRIRELQRAVSDAQRQIGQYQARVEAAPMVEQQLATVQRDYDLEKQQYSELSAKLHASTIAENVERNRSGEQFTILYPASYPTEPTKPVPWRVMLCYRDGSSEVDQPLICDDATYGKWDSAVWGF